MLDPIPQSQNPDSLWFGRSSKSTRGLSLHASPAWLGKLLVFFIILGAALTSVHAVVPQAAQDDPMYAQGFLVVSHYPGVTINGDASTAGATTNALNEAIADAYANNLVAYFPEGTYVINDTLKAWTDTGKPISVPGAAFATPRVHLALIGSTKGARPLIKLIDGAAGFGDSGNPKTVVEFKNFNVGAIGVDGQEAQASGYYQMLRGIDVDCGSGNAGAIGVYFNQAQGSSIEDVKVTATGAFAGFKGLPGRGAPVVNIEVEGGLYGIDTNGTSNVGTVVAGAILRNQTVSAVRHNSAFFPLVITGFEIVTPTGSTQAAVTTAGSAQSSGSAIHLIDGSIVLGGEPAVAAIDNRASRIFYARNVYVFGGSNLVKSTNANPTITGTGTWKLINEYSYCNQASADGNGKIAVDIIDGVVTRTPGPLANGEVVSITDNASAPPADLVTRHGWIHQPSVDDSDAFDAFNAGIVPGNISSEALQQVIDTHRKVFLRKGIYYLDGIIGHNAGAPVYGPITLHHDSILFGAARHLTRIEVQPSWDPTSETAMITTDDDATATTYIGSLTLGVDATDLANDWFVALDWQAGRNSMVHIGHVYREPAFTNPNPRVETNAHSLLRVRNHGGGRWYAAGSRKNFTAEDPDKLFRIFKAEGTTEPLWIYGLNMEGAGGTDAYAEFNNVSNVRIYAVKTESAEYPSGAADDNILLKYINVTNLAQFGHSAIRDAATDRGTVEFLGAGTDRVLATLVCPQTGTVVPNSDTLRENLTGLPADNVGILFPNVVALYKRGEITAADEAAMSHAAVSYAPVDGNQPPSVQITSPTDGATVGLLPTTISASASDSDGTIAVVNFYVNGALIGSDATAPYQVTWTPAAEGNHTINAIALDNESASTGSVSVHVNAVSAAALTEVVFNSIGSEDGRIIESSATSEVGGNNFPNASGSTALRMGDDGTNRQFRNIVSFDTSTLPANAVIVNASLELNRGGGAQGNTSAFGEIVADIRTGAFGTSNTLENVDFQSPATASQVAILSAPALDGEWAVGSLDSAGLAAINRTGGRTQFRVYYSIPDNGNNAQDFVPFFGGASTTPATRPILRINYALGPTITMSPTDQSAMAGDTVTFAITATGTGPLAYQWRFNGVEIANNASAQTATLTLASVTNNDIGTYDCVVSNPIGSVTSAPAALSVTASPGGPFQLVLSSISSEDGRIIESNATSEVGGNNFPNASGTTALRMGDDGTNRQYRNIVSFDTSSLPANALILSATLELNRGSNGAQGSTEDLGPLLVDIRTGAFGTSNALENVDFQSVPTAAQVASMSLPVAEGDWSIGQLNQAGLDAINRTGGRTQFRVYFSISDNGNNSQDFLPFYGGASSTPGTQPILRINYTIPSLPVIATQPVSQSVTVGDTVTFTVAVSGSGSVAYQWRHDGTPIAGNASAQTATLMLPAVSTGAAGAYDCVISNTSGSVTSDTATLAVAKAHAVVSLGGLSQTYDGSPRAVTAATVPGGLAVVLTYDGTAVPPTNAGSYAVSATIVDADYFGGAAGTLVVAPAPATIALAGLSQTYDGTPRSVTATTSPAGLSVNLTYDGGAVAPTNAGSYAVAATIADPNYTGSAGGTLVVAKATATITLDPLTQSYDGTPRVVTATTIPGDLAVVLTYDGAETAPTNPGTYEVEAVIDDANYTGSLTDTLVVGITAFVRHGFSLNGGIDGSVQVQQPEDVTLNGNGWVSGDLLIPGTPTVQLNGQPVFAGVIDGAGNETPDTHRVTLNGNSVLRHLVRRSDAPELPVIAAPALPTGTRDVFLNNSSQGIGDPATLRNLTLNGNGGSVALPPGNYGTVTLNGGNTLILGTAGSEEPQLYELQGLVLNGNSSLQLAGPVRIRLANGVTLNASVGDASNPRWLVVEIASGGLTLNGNAEFTGSVVAPSGTVNINGNSTLHGEVIADRLVLNGNGLLENPEL